jgi:hypothetical protein
LVALVALALMFHHDWKHIFDDLNVYSGWGHLLAEGQVPSADPMWQYPPMAAFVFGAIGLLGSAPWLYALLFVGVDIAITVVFVRDAQRRGSWGGVAVWLAAPLLLGPIMYGRYDSVPTLFALAGLLAVGTPLVAGIWLGLGGVLKLWPAFTAVAMQRRDWVKGAIGAVLAIGVTVVAAALTFPGITEGFLGNGEARGLQTESVAGLPFVWGRMFGADIPEAFRYGSSEVGVPLADAIAPWLLPLTAVGLIVLIVARLAGRLDRSPVADIAFVVVLWLMVTSRVLSPQYNVWLIGIAALVWASGSRAMRDATVPAFISAVAAQWLYPYAYIDIIDGDLLGVTLQTIRIVALVAAFVMAVRVLVRTSRTAGDPLGVGIDAPSSHAADEAAADRAGQPASRGAGRAELVRSVP